MCWEALRLKKLPFGIVFLAAVQFVAAVSAQQETEAPAELRQPILTAITVAQDPKPDEEKPDEKKPDETPAKSPSDIKPKPLRRVTRTPEQRDEMLNRVRELRLAGVKPMWGDFMGINPASLVITEPGGLDVLAGSGFPLSEGGSIAIRRMKLSENNSPLPMDRWTFGHNFFNDVRNVGDVNRYMFGVEKTYDEGLGSFAIRFPFESRLANSQSLTAALDGLVGERATEAGDLTLIWKRIVAADTGLLTTAGLGLRIPTAGDGQVLLAGQEVFRVEHKSLHLAPYLAVLGAAKKEKIFWQAFLQVDVPVNGNPVTMQTSATERTTLGILQDSTLLFADFGVGYKWLEEREGWIKQVVPMLELHYASTLNETDALSFDIGLFGFDLVDEARRYNILNLTAAVDLKLSDRLSIRPAFSFPLRTGTDRLYDFEAGIQVNLLH
jgi:hypothetical protein